MPSRNSHNNSHTHKIWVPKSELHRNEEDSNNWEGEKFDGNGQEYFESKINSNQSRDESLENGIWEDPNLFFHRGASLELISAEESERQERIREGQNEQLALKFKAIQSEFMSRVSPSSNLSINAQPIIDSVKENFQSAKEIVSEKAENLKEVVNENIESAKTVVSENIQSAKEIVNEKTANLQETVKEKVEDIQEGSIGWTKYTFDTLESLKENLVEKSVHLKDSIIESSSHLKEDLLERSTHLVEVAKESIGLATVDPSSIKAEEIEKARRINEKVEPMFDARKRRVEEELLGLVKSSV